MTEPVAIIGLGVAFPGAHSPERFYDNLLRGRCLVRQVLGGNPEDHGFIDPDRSAVNSTYSVIGALVDDPVFDAPFFRIPPSVARRMSRAQKLGLICAREALRDAGLMSMPEEQRNKTSVMMAAIGSGDTQLDLYTPIIEKRTLDRLRNLAGESGPDSAAARLLDSYASRFPAIEANEDSLPGASPNLVAGRIASAFDFHGMNLVLDAACASSLTAMHLAARSLQTRESDVVIAGGVDTWVDIGAFIQFAKITALAEHGCFPFDERADGLVIGEGCGVVVLKRLEDALRDRNTVYAVLRGTGASSDGRSTGITAPTEEGQLLAMRRAYDAAGISPDRLHYMECHGTGTRVGDPIELRSVDRLLRDAGRTSANPLPVGSVKASVGHLRTAAGMAGLCNAIKIIQHGVIPGQINFEKPTSGFSWSESVLRVPVRPVLLEHEDIVTGVSGFGFGGTNCHAVLSSPPRATCRPSNGMYRQRATAAVPEIDGDIAWLFPGQGSQYIGMLAELRETPVGKDLFARADRIVEELTGVALSGIVYPSKPAADAEMELRRAEFAQPALFTVSAILSRLLSEHGIRSAMMIGHSLGEYSALHAADAYSFETGVRMVAFRGVCMAMPEAGHDPGLMAYLHGDPDQIEALTLNREGIYTANINSYRQRVFSGSASAIDLLIRDAKAGGLIADRLKVSSGFHSPLVSYSNRRFRSMLEQMSVAAPAMPVPANISGAWYPVAQKVHGLPADQQRRELIDMLVAQIDRPVDFVSQIERAYQAGVRRFIEAGPGRVLAGLVSEILQGKPAQIIALDASKGEALNRIASLSEELKKPLAPIYPKFRTGTRASVRRTRPRPAAGKSEDLTVQDQIRAVVASVSGYEKGAIGDDADFDRDLGLDSIKIVEIIARLRGSVIPADYRGFRHLTSVRSILSVAETSRASGAQAKPAPSFQCYRNSLASIQRARLADAREDAWIFNHSGSWLPDGKAGGQLAIVRTVESDQSLLQAVVPGILGICAGLAGKKSNDGPSRVAIITAGRDGTDAERVYRTLVGLVRSVAMELPAIQFSYHHLDGPHTDTLVADCLADAAIGRRRLMDGTWQADVLTPLENVSEESGSLPWISGQDVVLVTGGARGIASVIVRDLLARTGARFVLMGRGRESEPWCETEGAGRIEYVCADVGDEKQVASLNLAARGITILLHAAGVTCLEPLARQQQAQWERVIGAKAAGLDHLVSALDRSRLRMVVNFSSIVAHFGNYAQADYAAANGYLDGYVCEGVPVLSIGWTAWDDIGMAVRGATRHVMDASGIQRLPPQTGAAYFRRILNWWYSQPAPPGSCVVEVFGDLGSTADHARIARGSPEREVLPGSIRSPDSVHEDVVILNADGTATPAFLICGIFGYGYRLQLVAREMDPEVPVYILQPPGMNWKDAGCETIDEMARWYADRIQQLRPEGPIGLAGTSFGGNMAFELACVLQARGRTVAFLAMIDTMPFGEDPLEFEALQKNIRRMEKRGSDRLELDSTRIATQQLGALRKHERKSVFRGVLHYGMAMGMGYPGARDRRFDWESCVTDGMRIVPVSCVHGGFVKEPARQEVARFFELLAMGRDPGGRTSRDFRAFKGEAEIQGTGAGRVVALANGQRLPLAIAHGSGGIDALKFYHNRIWLAGWLSGNVSRQTVRDVHIYLQNRFVHGATADRNRFMMVADFLRCQPQKGDLITVVAVTDGKAAEIAELTWPPRQKRSYRHTRLAAWIRDTVHKYLGA